MYAIEASNLADWTEKIVKANKMEDKIIVVKRKVEVGENKGACSLLISCSILHKSLQWRNNIWLHRVPTQTGKPEKMGGIYQPGNFEQTGKVREKSHKILEKSGHFRQMLFIIFWRSLNELCIIC